MINTHEIYGRVVVDDNELKDSSDFIWAMLINEKDILKTNNIYVGKVALKNKGGYKPKNRPNTLVEQFMPLAYGAASHLYRGGTGNNFDWEELLQVACVGLCEAAKRYDNTKNNGFVAFARPYIHGYVKNFINPERNGLMNIIEAKYGVLDNMNADINVLSVEDDNLNTVLYGAIEDLTLKQKFAVEMFHLQGHTQAQVAKMLETDARAVRRLLKRASDTLKKTLFEAFN